MSNVVRNYTTEIVEVVEKKEKRVADGVTVTFNEAEAQTLLLILGNMSGPDAMGNIYHQLVGVGIEKDPRKCLALRYSDEEITNFYIKTL